jgi:predicted O-methyltransferase YrrM
MRRKMPFFVSIVLLVFLSLDSRAITAQPQSESAKWEMASIRELARGYMSSRIFLTAMELGIFSQLKTQELTSSQMAQKLNTDQRATEILLNALTGMGLLKKNGNLFANVEEVADLLIPECPHYQGGGFGHTADLWEAWSQLTETVRSGQPFEKEWTDEMRLDFALAMKQHAKGTADRLAMLVDCSGVKYMLDLGGGPGSYAIAFAQQYPHLTAVVFDKDNHALRIAKEDILSQNLQGRISVRKGDFFVDDIGSNYDLVLLSSIIHAFGVEENTFLLRKVAESLKEGGRVVIRDFILDESKTKPASAAIFAVNMLVNTQNGRSYSFSEVKGWLQSLGFKDIRMIPMGRSQLIIGTKRG